MPLARILLGNRITLQIDAKHPVSRIFVDPSHLERTLLNLVLNARDAMPNGGVLDIESRPASYTDVRNLPRRDYVELSVKDNGLGMTDSVRARAMEPFFTTKPVGQGTGLGLSIVHRIVSDYGGELQVTSEPGAGTTVTVKLPLAAELAVAPAFAP